LKSEWVASDLIRHSSQLQWFKNREKSVWILWCLVVHCKLH